MEESATYQWILAEGRAEGREEGRSEGREEGRSEGREEGRSEGLRRAVLDLVEARLAAIPEGLEGRLSALDADALRGLFSRLVHAADTAELERLLAG